MPVTIEERFRSVSGGQDSRRIGYIVKGASSDIDALDNLELTVAASYDGMPLDDIEIEEVDYNNGIFYATATYNRRKPQAITGDSEFNFDFSLTSQRIVQSLSTVNSYVASGSATNFNKAIAVDADGVPQGVDIRVPTASFELRYYPANAVVNSAYQATVKSLVGKVNSDPFYGHAAGEVLFVGCSGGIRSGSDWELTFRFEVSENQTGLSIGGITGIAVDGWDVLWVYYKQDTDATTNRFIQTPKQVNVERVYERAAFSALGV